MRALIPATVIVIALGVGGCGKSEPEKVRDVVERFGAATKDGKWQTICDDLLAPRLVRNVEQIGLPCEVAWQKGVGAVRRPRLTIQTVVVREGRALVTVRSTALRQLPSRDTIELVRSGEDWRIAALRRPPAPRRAGRPAKPPRLR